MPGQWRECILQELPPMNWHVGCSGYQYDEWKGEFYPPNLPKRKWFTFYCEHFNSLELNNTFYRFPRIEYLKKWYSASPQTFTFSIKAPRIITHFKRLKDAQKFLDDFYKAVYDGLKDKAGCVLFQFPSNFPFTDENLERITSLLDHGVKNVVEFRHASWWNQTVYEALSKTDICFCGMSHPALPDDVVTTNDLIYYRFHGVPHLYISPYTAKQLENVKEKIGQSFGVKQAFVFFNNTQEMAALANAAIFSSLSVSPEKK